MVKLLKMKSIILNLFFGVIWVLICPYFPSIHLSSSYLVFPCVFFLSFYFFKPNVSCYIQIPINCLIILLIDFLFRLYAGGSHDQVGIALCDLNFFATLFTTIISSCAIILVSPSFTYKLPSNRINFKGIILNSIFIITALFITFFLFYFISYNK